MFCNTWNGSDIERLKSTNYFSDVTAMASAATTLIASFIVLGVTVLGWKLGRRWFQGIVK